MSSFVAVLLVAVFVLCLGAVARSDRGRSHRWRLGQRFLQIHNILRLSHAQGTQLILKLNHAITFKMFSRCKCLFGFTHIDETSSIILQTNEYRPQKVAFVYRFGCRLKLDFRLIHVRSQRLSGHPLLLCRFNCR